ncbi:hypothetical protein V5O48_012803 [Marasmius crinis-equi]|uniref:Uncharacterized protein n=1 Tax=Marasmius crinis-equi TaxID=585013 RepID=A0ABR3F269_9AGAR
MWRARALSPGFPEPDSSPFASSPSPSSPSLGPITPTPASCSWQARTYINGQRQQPTLENPVYGLLSAKKGSSEYEVLQTGALLGRVEKKNVNRRFVRNMDRLLLNCEKLADETDCWLYIAAHHPTSQGEFVHFTSPAMQKDLPPQACNVLDNTSSSLFSALKTARRQDLAAVELSAAKARAERDVALNEAAVKQRVIELFRAISNHGISMDLSQFAPSASAE